MAQTTLAKPLPNNWQTKDPEVLRRELNRLSDALTDTFERFASAFVERFSVMPTQPSPTLSMSTVQTSFGKAVRVDCQTGKTTKVVMPAASASDALREVALFRTSTGGTLTALPSAGYLINGATLAAVPSAIGMYKFTFDGLGFYSNR